MALENIMVLNGAEITRNPEGGTLMGSEWDGSTA